MIVLAGENPLKVALGSSFVDPGATATDAEDGNLVVTADCSSVDSNIVGSYQCTYSATDTDSNTSNKTRIVEVFDPDAPEETCEEVVGSPYAHIAAGRAYAGGT
ncbi:immunoglobulin-like domain-containing protein [Hahella sp. CCB-MM4]|uniref:immunoglobulin-like domain-containing protein n=1 Tax=Hahella sp. (strain CCB-MM4) TaxID=1926491 RepID=UPI001AEF65F1|nr:immunoglobulin-like domain-containing protein [Hahella sp. CCB-MM4]